MTQQAIGGIHAVMSLLQQNQRRIDVMYVLQDRTDERIQVILTKAESLNIPIKRLSSQRMQAQFGELMHQGIVALAEPLPLYTERDLAMLLGKSKQPCLILILDGVTDPHNFGACLRSADAAGVDFVVVPKDKSAPLTPVVSKVASGAAESVPVVRVTNLVRAMEVLKQEGVWIYGAAGEATSMVYDLDCKGSLALVMGSEGDGLRRLTREHCDDLYALPMLGTVTSLNVSVATGISLFEVVRQRRAINL